jgi:hypothetical protein
MGRIDRCAALRNLNGVGSSDRLEGHEATYGINGLMGLEFGTAGFGAWSIPMQQASPKVGSLVWDGAPSLMLTMALVKKSTVSSLGA